MQARAAPAFLIFDELMAAAAVLIARGLVFEVAQAKEDQEVRIGRGAGLPALHAFEGQPIPALAAPLPLTVLPVAHSPERSAASAAMPVRPGLQAEGANEVDGMHDDRRRRSV